MKIKKDFNSSIILASLLNGCIGTSRTRRKLSDQHNLWAAIALDSAMAAPFDNTHMKSANACNIQVLWFCLFCFIMSCSSAAHIDYTPDFSNVRQPLALIKSTIEQQPPAYASLPVTVEVTDRRIAIYVEESGVDFLPSLRSDMSVVLKNYYFKNLGAPKLSNAPIWNVMMYDKSGYYLYCVYVSSEKEAKAFIDALAYMIEKNRQERQ